MIEVDRTRLQPLSDDAIAAMSDRKIKIVLLIDSYPKGRVFDLVCESIDYEINCDVQLSGKFCSLGNLSAILYRLGFPSI